jgi:hypothetical protein
MALAPSTEPSRRIKIKQAIAEGLLEAGAFLKTRLAQLGKTVRRINNPPAGPKIVNSPERKLLEAASDADSFIIGATNMRGQSSGGSPVGSYSKFRLLAEEVHNSTFDILCVTETKLTRVGMEMTSLIAHQLGLKVVHSHPRSPGGRGSLIIWKPHCDLIQGSTHTDSQSRLVVQKFHLPGKNKSLQSLATTWRTTTFSAK